MRKILIFIQVGVSVLVHDARNRHEHNKLASLARHDYAVLLFDAAIIFWTTIPTAKIMASTKHTPPTTRYAMAKK